MASDGTPSHLRVTDRGSCRFGGKMQDVQRCALAVQLDSIGGPVGVELAMPSCILNIGNVRWEGIEVFRGYLLLERERSPHGTEFMIVRPDGAADQHCQWLTFASSLEDSDIDSNPDGHRSHQVATALVMLIEADL